MIIVQAQHTSGAHSSRSTSFPRDFSALTHWPGLISPVPDQANCPISWAVSAVSVASDRISIGQGSPVVLDPQAVLYCGRGGQFKCKEAPTDLAWNYLRRFGVWEISCPSNFTWESCSSTECKRHRTLPAYMVGREGERMKDIMQEIMSQGPVQAIIQVYADLFLYESGIYQRSKLPSNSILGFHGVRIVGWGEEAGLKYWKVANSWGNQWGEEGYFMIIRGENECSIEEFVMAVWPKKTRARRRRQRRE